jgi:hypothetical protein
MKIAVILLIIILTAKTLIPDKKKEEEKTEEYIRNTELELALDNIKEVIAIYDKAEEIYELAYIQLKLEDDCSRPSGKPAGGDKVEYIKSNDPKEDFLRRREYRLRLKNKGTSKELKISFAEKQRRKYAEKHTDKYSSNKDLIFGANKKTKALNDVFNKGFYKSIVSNRDMCFYINNTLEKEHPASERIRSILTTPDGNKFRNILCNKRKYTHRYSKDRLFLMEAAQGLYSRHLLYLEITNKLERENKEYLTKFNKLHKELISFPLIKGVKLKDILPFNLNKRMFKNAKKTEYDVIRFKRCIEP